MSQAFDQRRLRFIDPPQVVRPAELPLEEHVRRARSNNAAMNMLVAVESAFVRYESASEFEIRAGRVRMPHDRYYRGIDHGGWFVDRSDPEHPVSLKFNEEVQDALRPEARDIAKQRLIDSDAKRRLHEIKQKAEEQRKKEEHEMAVQNRMREIQVSQRENELSSLFSR